MWPWSKLADDLGHERHKTMPDVALRGAFVVLSTISGFHDPRHPWYKRGHRRSCSGVPIVCNQMPTGPPKEAWSRAKKKPVAGSFSWTLFLCSCSGNHWLHNLQRLRSAPSHQSGARLGDRVSDDWQSLRGGVEAKARKSAQVGRLRSFMQSNGRLQPFYLSARICL